MKLIAILYPARPLIWRPFKDFALILLAFSLSLSLFALCSLSLSLCSLSDARQHPRNAPAALTPTPRSHVRDLYVRARIREELFARGDKRQAAARYSLTFHCFFLANKIENGNKQNVTPWTKVRKELVGFSKLDTIEGY